jgi:hypothetical protein
MFDPQVFCNFNRTVVLDQWSNGLFQKVGKHFSAFEASIPMATMNRWNPQRPTSALFQQCKSSWQPDSVCNHCLRFPYQSRYGENRKRF